MRACDRDAPLVCAIQFGCVIECVLAAGTCYYYGESLTDELGATVSCLLYQHRVLHGVVATQGLVRACIGFMYLTV